MTNSKLNNPGIIYFVQEKDLLGYSTPNYVKIGLVKDNEIGRSGEDKIMRLGDQERIERMNTKQEILDLSI